MSEKAALSLTADILPQEQYDYKILSGLSSRMGLIGSKNQLMSNEKFTSGSNPKNRSRPPPAPPKVSLQLCVLMKSSAAQTVSGGMQARLVCARRKWSNGRNRGNGKVP